MLGLRDRFALQDGEFAASAPNNILRLGGLEELKAIAEGATLANQGVYLHGPVGQGEFETNDFVQLYLLSQHGGDSGFADVYSVPANDRTVAGIDANVDFQLEAGMTAGVHNLTSRAGSELTAAFQSLIPDRRDMRA